jgi:hypothetical protein
VGLVVSTTNAEPVDWFPIESRLENISTSVSPRPIGPSADSQDSASGGSGVISLSSEYFPVRDRGMRFIAQANDMLVARDFYKHWSF